MGNCLGSSSKSRPLSSAAQSSSTKSTSSTTHSNPKAAMALGNGDSQALVVHDSSSMVLGGEMDTLRTNYKASEAPVKETHKSSKFPTVVLVPHQHTLFCERKQRVCTAVGKYQELEILKVRYTFSRSLLAMIMSKYVLFLSVLDRLQGWTM